MIPKFRDIMKFLLLQSGATMFERFDGSIAPVSLDPAQSATRNISDGEIYTDDAGLAIWDYDTIPTSTLITELHLFYKSIAPRDGGWSGYRFCKRSGAGGELYTPDWTAAPLYSGYMESAFEITNEERPLTIYFPGIRDDSTAEALAEIIMYYRTTLWYILDLQCSYSVLDIEMFDNVGCTSTVIHSFLQGSIWKVLKQRIVPNIKGKKGRVQMQLLQIYSSVSPEPTEQWTDVLTGGTSKVDVLTGGESIQEVL